MRRLNISLIVQALFTTISAASLLDFMFHSPSILIDGRRGGPPGIPESPADPPHKVWDLVPINALTSAEASLMNRLRSIAERPSPSDCFKRSVSSLTTKCGEELEPDENARVRLAISMTLCELHTAAHADIPLECSDFSHKARLRASDTNYASQAACVGALSRSPQYWSSYSGYLRDVPQLCFAFRRWHDIDTAHLIQRNTSLEALNLLVLLRDREKTESKKDRLMKSTMAAMEIMMRELQSSVDGVREAPREALVKAGDMISQLIREHSKTMDDLHEALALQLQQSHELVVRELRQAIISSVEKHSEAMAAARDSANDHSRDAYQLFQQQHELCLNALDILDAKWQGFVLRMLTLHESTETVLASTSRVSSELDIQFRKVLEHQDVIDRASRSLHTLSASLENLATLAEDRLISINKTAWEVQNVLSASGTRGWLVRAGELVFRNTYSQLQQADMRHFAILIDVIYYILPAYWYIIRGTRVLGGLATAMICKTGACAAILLSVSQRTLLGLLSSAMKTWNDGSLESDQRVDVRYRSTGTALRNGATVKGSSVRLAGFEALRASTSLSPTFLQARDSPAHNSNRGLFRSTSLPPLMMSEGSKQEI